MCKLDTDRLRIMADVVNAAPNPSRREPLGIDAVRGQISSAHNKRQPKNKAIFDLLVKSTEFRIRMAAGEAIPRAERKPRAAIPLEESPVDTPLGAIPPWTSDSKKRKRASAVEEMETSGSELSSLAVSEFGDDCSV